MFQDKLYYATINLEMGSFDSFKIHIVLYCTVLYSIEKNNNFILISEASYKF